MNYGVPHSLKCPILIFSANSLPQNTELSFMVNLQRREWSQNMSKCALCDAAKGRILEPCVL